MMEGPKTVLQVLITLLYTHTTGNKQYEYKHAVRPPWSAWHCFALLIWRSNGTLTMKMAFHWHAATDLPSLTDEHHMLSLPLETTGKQQLCSSKSAQVYYNFRRLQR